MLSYWFMWPAFIADRSLSFFVEGGAAASRLDRLSAAFRLVMERGAGSQNGQTLWLWASDRSSASRR